MGPHTIGGTLTGISRAVEFHILLYDSDKCTKHHFYLRWRRIFHKRRLLKSTDSLGRDTPPFLSKSGNSAFSEISIFSQADIPWNT